MEIKGKRVVITGASTGIGRALAIELAEKFNATIVVAARHIDSMKNISPAITAYACDVSKREELDGLFDFAVKKMGGVDIFIANAGYAYYEKIEHEDWDHIEKIYKVNVISPIYAAEKMAVINKDREYCMAVTGSAMGKLALPGYTIYASTKAALDSFAHGYRYDVPKNGHFMLIYPIATKTNFFNNAGSGNDIPQAWPQQSADYVAHKIISGIKNNKKYLFPSKLFITTYRLNNYFPFINSLYLKIEARKFNKWYNAQKK